MLSCRICAVLPSEKMMIYLLPTPVRACKYSRLVLGSKLCSSASSLATFLYTAVYAGTVYTETQQCTVYCDVHENLKITARYSILD